MKKFERKMIEFNFEGEINYNRKLTTIRADLTNFFNEIEKYIEVKNKSAYKENLMQQFKEEFSDKHKKDFPPILSLERVMELCDVDFTRLNFLIVKVDNAAIDIDFDTQEPTEQTDFGYYTENENQNFWLTYLQNICNAIYTSDRPTTHFWNADLVRGFGNMLNYDFATQKLKPNKEFIKTIKI